MNWKDAETDEWLRARPGRDRPCGSSAKYYALVQKKVTEEHL